jgi:hypothetical protein
MLLLNNKVNIGVFIGIIITGTFVPALTGEGHVPIQSFGSGSLPGARGRRPAGPDSVALTRLRT